ncbi:unnamed protein product [Ophioblennius macclurei]
MCVKIRLHRLLLSFPKHTVGSARPVSFRLRGIRTQTPYGASAVLCPSKCQRGIGKVGLLSRSHCDVTDSLRSRPQRNLLQGRPSWPVSFVRRRVTDTSLSSVPPAFVVMQFDQEGNVTTFEKKKTELCQELSLQARDLRFQHSTSLTARNNCIIIRLAVRSRVSSFKRVIVNESR